MSVYAPNDRFGSKAVIQAEAFLSQMLSLTLIAA